MWFGQKRKPVSGQGPLGETLPQTAHELSNEERASGRLESPDTRRAQRLPPGQSKAKKWPVLQWSQVPKVDLNTWRLRVFGLVRRETTLTWDELRALPQITVHADMHCVTTWSRLDQNWEGVSLRTLLDLAQVPDEARYCVAHGADGGYETNMPIEYLRAKDALVAWACNDEPLSAEHGGPVRLVVPQLYAWKSCKWLTALEFLRDDRSGLWERNGYHDRGDPWREERYS
jgi:DMSO/TMAO reductase YedYZ molybdopterin-dependent catalytic subunit